MSIPATPRSALSGAATVLIVGMIAALGAGKIPAALGLMATQFSMSLFQASFLIGLFQLALGLGGVFAGSLADRFGHRNIMQLGLAMTLVGITLALFAQSTPVLLLSRSIESIGFMFTVLPGPALIRQLVPPHRLQIWLGGWGTYMPTGFALALLATPWLMQIGGNLSGVSDLLWTAAWLAHGLLSLAGLLALRRFVPAASGSGGVQTNQAGDFSQLLIRTLGARGPWILAAMFGAYAGQYMSIVSFLPTIYGEAGLSLASAGALTALVAGVNLLGNLAAGRLIGRGVNPGSLLIFASVVLIFGAWLVFLSDLSFLLRYAVVVSMSAIIGLLPGTLFVLAPRYAPDPETVSSSVGLMLQGSGIGQFMLPPVVAWSAGMAGGWSNTGWVLGFMALINLGLSIFIWRHEDRRGRLA